ncbi:XdhC family protein [Aquimarina sp. RZ0]|uniref:XdhC family protein n=1 Tax=Aquimarina sp. RZ0 TaxID=2607730 RepID=UPI0011F16A98|nr:XdhC/CoxI family protein [Aquimarina sp. RZ0]KAA1245954.1 XdhC family protein [Aquimarina sp. RZ0]
MTHEFKEIINAYQKASKKGIRAVIATVVDIDGSSYRRPGVGMLLLENGEMIGAVSGGCVEKEVFRQSQSVFASGTAKIMTYNGRYRLGCEGILYILIEPFIISNVVIHNINRYLASRTSFVIKSYYSKEEENNNQMGSVVCFDGVNDFSFSNQMDVRNLRQNSLFQCFDRVMLPCFRLIIIGAEHDAKELCKLASATGWEVEVVSGPKSPKFPKDFPEAHKVSNLSPENLVIENVDKQTGIVLMTHNFAKDVLYLQALKDVSPIYIGLLGPARRREKLLSAFIEYFPDVDNEFLDCIYGPAGLNLGAETPQEIAISIIAELLSVIRNQKPISLQEKVGGIHGNSAERILNSFVD